MLFSQLYRVLVPKFIRKRILAKQLPIAVQKYYSSLPESPSEEIATALEYLKSHPLTVFPYPFEMKYSADKIAVFEDKEKGLKYVWQDGKKLYFKKRWSSRKIREVYNLLLKEQDISSPHRYLTPEFVFDTNSVLVDVGVAEGNFALSVVDQASKIILFETDKEWIAPLQATFEPWKDKVQIIDKYVSDISDAHNIRLDDLLPLMNETVFLKIDVDGAEARLISGAEQFIRKQNPIKIAICTYHKQNDEKEFQQYLQQEGFVTEPSKNYMLFYLDKKIKAPYFRRGLLRASRT